MMRQLRSPGRDRTLHADCMAASATLRVLRPKRIPISEFGDDGRRPMIELLLIAQTLRNPMQALARRWYCRGLYRATRGARGCKGCTAS